MNRNLRRFFLTGALILLTSWSAFAQIENTGVTDAWTIKDVTRAHNSSDKASYVKQVRAGKQKDFDRVVFEFEGPFPNYLVQYLKSPFYESEAGRERIRQPGTAFLQVEFFLIPTEEKQVNLSKAGDFIPKRRLSFLSVQSVREKVLFEGFYDFLIGVRTRKAFRVSELSNPARLVIDVQH